MKGLKRFSSFQPTSRNETKNDSLEAQNKQTSTFCLSILEFLNFPNFQQHFQTFKTNPKKNNYKTTLLFVLVNFFACAPGSKRKKKLFDHNFSI